MTMLCFSVKKTCYTTIARWLVCQLHPKWIQLHPNCLNLTHWSQSHPHQNCTSSRETMSHVETVEDNNASVECTLPMENHPHLKQEEALFPDKDKNLPPYFHAQHQNSLLVAPFSCHQRMMVPRIGPRLSR